MRWVLLCLLLLIPVAFVIGRETSSSTISPPRPKTTSNSRVYTIHGGDVIRVPATSTRCEASHEGGVPNLVCSRNFEGRYEVVFYKDTVFVFRVGDPDNPRVFRWEP